MVIRCPVCKRIKKFGKWIEVPRYLEEEVKKVPVVFVTCEHCKREASAISNPLEALILGVVCN